jgi:Domain of unknown function (DUF6259)
MRQIHKPLLFTLAIICTGTVHCAVTAVDKSNKIIVNTPRLIFELASKKQGMGILSIKSTKGTEFIKRPANPAKASLWRVKLTPDYHSEKNFITVYNYDRCRATKVVNTNGAVKLIWQGVDVGTDKNVLDVTMTIAQDKESGLNSFKIAIVNHSKKYGIWHVYSPEFELGQIGKTANDDFLLMCPAEGRSVRNPVYWDRERKIEKDKFMLTTDEMAKISNKQAATGYGFGSHEPYGLPYPTARGQMQLNAYYQKKGSFYYPSQTKGPGLYLSAHDNASNPKVFYATGEPNNKLLRFVVGQLPNDSAKPGLDYHQKWPMIVDYFEGDWYDAAMIYRKFAMRAPWTKQGALATRKDIPEWLKKTTVWIRLSNNRGRKVTAWAKIMADYRKYLHGPLAVQWYAWDDALKKKYRGCGSFPPIPDAQKGFGKIVKDWEKQNMFVTPYVNSRLWSKKDPNQEVRRDFNKALPHIQQKADGKLALWGHKKNEFMKMCLHRKFWQNYLADTCYEIVKKYRVPSIYLDQAGEMSYGGGYYNIQSCFDKTHGHPLGVTPALFKSEHKRLKMILEKCQQLNPQIVLSGEGAAESFIDVMSNKLIHYEIWPGYVPAFNAVYHDFVTSYGRTVSLTSQVKTDPLPTMTMGWQLVIGNQLGRLWPTRLGRNKQIDKNFDYLVKISALRNAFYKHLTLGRMLRPVQMSEVPVITTGEFRRINHICKLPAILSGTWADPKGNVAIVLTNISEKPVTFTIKFDPAEYGLTPKCKLMQVFPGAKTLSSTITGKYITAQMTVPGREILFIKLSKDGKKLPGVKYKPPVLPTMKGSAPQAGKIKNFTFENGPSQWQVRYPKNFTVNTNDEGRYIEFRGSKEHNYLYMAGTLPLKVVPGKKFRFGGTISCKNMTGNLQLAIRQVNAGNKSIFYSRQPVKKACSNLKIIGVTKIHKDCTKLQFYILGSNIRPSTRITIKDLFFISVK